MARGNPAYWSVVFALPMFVLGGILYITKTPYPKVVGIPFIAFGGLIVVIGVYIQVLASPDPPKLREGEELLQERHPTQRVAFVKIGIGMPLLVATVYLLFFTWSPYIYPVITLLLGLYFFTVGLHTYWTNTLTKYYVTTERVIREYRFISQIRQEIPTEKIRLVQERRSVTEALVGLGNVQVASGDGLKIVMRNMFSSPEFAETVRNVA